MSESARPKSTTTDNRPRLHVGGTVDPRQHIYIKRPQDEELFRALRKGEYCNVMTSRQMGKSSAMRYAALRLLDAGVAVADIDLAGNLGTSHVELSQWYVGFLRHICQRLRVKLDVQAWWDAHDDSPPSQRLQDFFGDALIPAVDKPIVLFLDEIDVCLKLDFTSDFFVAIRAMYNQRSEVPAYQRITFCLLGVAQPNELIRDKRVTPYNIGTNIQLHDFDREADDLSPLIKVLDGQGGAGADKLDAIFAWTDGHPFLTTSLCQKSLDEKCRTVADIEELLQSTYRHVEVVRRDTHFRSIARFLDVRGGLETIKLYSRILDGQRVNDDIDETKAQLKLSGLVKADASGGLVVRNRIYRQVFDRAWIRNTQPRKSVRRLWLVAVIATLLLGALASWVAWDRLVRAPRARQEAAERERRTNKANGSLATLRATDSEEKAARAYALLSCQQMDDIVEACIAGYEDQATLLYEAFWQRRAAFFEELAKGTLQEAQDEHEDEALILAALAAVKGDRAVTAEPYQAIHDMRRYDFLITTLRGHRGAVNAAAYTPDGRALVTVSDDGHVMLWNPLNGAIHDDQVAAQLGGKPVSLASVSIAEVDGEVIAVTAANDGFINLWRVAETEAGGYKLEQRDDFYVDRNVYGPTYHAVLHPQGHMLLTAGDYARLWDIDNGRLVLRAQASENVFSAEFSPDLRQVVTASGRGVAEIWPVELRRASPRVLNHGLRTQVLRAVFDDEGNVATAALDGRARLWSRVQGWRLLHEYRHAPPALDTSYPLVTSVSVCGGDDEQSRLATAARAEGSDASVVVIWNRQGEVVRTLPGHWAVYDVDFSPDCAHLAASGASGLVRIWSTEKPHDRPASNAPQERWLDWQARFNLTVDDTGRVMPLRGAEPGRASGLADMRNMEP